MLFKKGDKVQMSERWTCLGARKKRSGVVVGFGGGTLPMVWVMFKNYKQCFYHDYLEFVPRVLPKEEIQKIKIEAEKEMLQHCENKN